MRTDKRSDLRRTLSNADLGFGEPRAVEIPVAGSALLHGDLTVVDGAIGVVVFAHGSGSSRHSPRNREVARQLRTRRLGTLLIDLLTPDEEARDARGGQLRFDIELLSDRLSAAAAWLRADLTAPNTRSNERTDPIGYFGASTGAGAALLAAARHPGDVGAVVSRGGRPDLAGAALARVQAPTMLIVGGLDEEVIRLNRQAHDQLRVERRLEIVPDASHLFEEPGALERVAELAGDWFEHHLGRDEPGRGSS